MSVNIFTSNEFKLTDIFLSYSDTVKAILTKLMDAFDAENVAYVVKVRKDNSIVFALKDKTTSNLATIFIYQEHIRLLILNSYDEKLTIEDLDSIYAGEHGVIDNIIDKYHQLSRKRKQYSIYVYSDVIEKLEALAKEKDGNANRPTNVNKLIEDALEALAMDTFINANHKREFLVLMESAGIITVYNADVETLTKIATFYLLSAYQSYYFSYYKVKFIYNAEEGMLYGPASLIEEAELGYKNAETAYLAAKFLRSPKDNSNLFPHLLSDMSNNKEITHLINVAFKILGGGYFFSAGELKDTSKLLLTAIQIFEI